MPRTIDIFFYGLFMDHNLLRNQGLNPTAPSKAYVEGMALQIGDRAMLVPKAGARAYGMVMGLTDPEIQRLYSEPSVSAYLPEAFIAVLEDDSRIPVLCFNLPAGFGSGPSNSSYAANLRDLACRLGLPADYVASIGA